MLYNAKFKNNLKFIIEIIYSIKGILSSPWGEVLFVSIDLSICSVVIKGESSISDVSLFYLKLSF